MSSSAFEKGRDDARAGKYSPPGDLIAETTSDEAYEIYHEQREEYRAGRDAADEDDE